MSGALGPILVGWWVILMLPVIGGDVKSKLLLFAEFPSCTSGVRFQSWLTAREPHYFLHPVQ